MRAASLVENGGSGQRADGQPRLPRGGHLVPRDARDRGPPRRRRGARDGRDQRPGRPRADVRLERDGDGIVRLEATVTGPRGAEAVGIAFDAPAGERYLGFGERSNAVDQTGNEVENYVAEGPYQPGEDQFIARVRAALGLPRPRRLDLLPDAVAPVDAWLRRADRQLRDELLPARHRDARAPGRSRRTPAR